MHFWHSSLSELATGWKHGSTNMILLGFPVKANSQRASEAFSPTCQRGRSLHGLSKAEGAGNASCLLHHWSSRNTGQYRILSLKSALSLGRCLQAALALEGRAVIPPVNMLADFFSKQLNFIDPA